MRFLPRFFESRKSSPIREIDPDEIFIDASNLPEFDTNRFEGRFERPLERRTFLLLACAFSLFFLILVGKVYALQIKNGQSYAERSENNHLRQTVIFAERGTISDRNGVPLASNVINSSGDFPLRQYSPLAGLGHLLGYISYPSKDSSGFYYQEKFIGKDGLEATYDETLSGKPGLKITETDAAAVIQSESIVEPPQNGKNLSLSIDSRVQSALFGYIKELSERLGFTGGAGAIMDIHTGEMLALTSYPEYSPQILTDGKDRSVINGYLRNPQKPFLDRMLSGLYAPGSIVKPFLAIGALQEKIISPDKQILSTGSISIPNPYAPGQKSVFMDWRPQGLVDMRKAIAVSSDVYFYEIGGGFEDQKGLGIDNIKKYMHLFGFGEETGIDSPDEEVGVIPDPAWKLENFNGEPWRIGDTYHTAIGQYGVQVTPLQAVRATASLGNGGLLLTPTLLKVSQGGVVDAKKLPIVPENFIPALEGMRESVLEGTSKGLDIPSVTVAAKTGTAEIGIAKKTVNSWVIGLFPYENPRYAFVVIMERGPHENTVGGLYVMRQLFDWMHVYTPEYLKSTNTAL